MGYGRESVQPGKKKAQKHKLLGPVGLGMTPALTQGQTSFVPGTNPVCFLILHSGSPANRGRRAAETIYALRVYVPFSLANLSGLG